MKIVILSTIESYVWAGTEEVWYHFAKHALNAGHEVMLMAHQKVTGSTQVKELMNHGMKVSVRKPFRPMKVYLLKQMLYPDYGDVLTFKPDILLINSGSLFDVVHLPYLYRFCQSVNSRKVFFCHFVADMYSAHTNAKVKAFIEQMDKVLFVSHQNKRLASRQLGLSLSDAEVIENSSRLYLETPLVWPADDLYNFACVARLETLIKGHDVLLEVLSDNRWKARNWKLNIYGEGPDREYIESLIEFYGLTDKVNIVGYVSSVEDIWINNHIMILPSRGEGMPLAVLEAMMCGRPVVTTDVGGNVELIKHGCNGWVADAATARSLGSVLDEAWNNRSEWMKLGKLAHEKAKEMNAKNPASRLLNILAQGIGAV